MTSRVTCPLNRKYIKRVWISGQWGLQVMVVKNVGGPKVAASALAIGYLF